MKTYNKGEWSEPYLLLKLITDQKLYLGKENFEKVEDIFYQIIKIIHFEKNNRTEFSFDGDIVIIKGNNESFRIPLIKFVDICQSTLLSIHSSTSKKGSFALPELVKFLETINIHEVKAKSNSKNDITIQIEDPNTYISPTLGFSVKSQLGKPSTLVNSSSSTNFIYTLSKKISLDSIAEINNTRLFSEKFSIFKKLGIEFTFEDVQSEIFKINLQSIDYNFGKILSDILLLYYQNNKASQNTIEKLTEIITRKNEFNYNLELNPNIYKMIIKRFLVEYALGMRAAQVWTRDYQADGGYLIVREDGEILCYHFYFIKNFENYLFQNTKLETPSQNRYKMAEVYEEDDIQKMKLNLQIRFLK